MILPYLGTCTSLSRIHTRMYFLLRCQSYPQWIWFFCKLLGLFGTAYLAAYTFETGNLKITHTKQRAFLFMCWSYSLVLSNRNKAVGAIELGRNRIRCCTDVIAPVHSVLRIKLHRYCSRNIALVVKPDIFRWYCSHSTNEQRFSCYSTGSFSSWENHLCKSWKLRKCTTWIDGSCILMVD
jgi:hypothetical protein